MQGTKKVALITGANKGIGFEVARQIAKAGWTVLAAARNEETGRQAVSKLQAEGLDVQFVPSTSRRTQPQPPQRRPFANSSAKSTFSSTTLALQV
jgi:NAD(P)-dependent dehydrogenase (short-subunit alcohol dehydrogenase family)